MSHFGRNRTKVRFRALQSGLARVDTWRLKVAKCASKALGEDQVTKQEAWSILKGQNQPFQVNFALENWSILTRSDLRPGIKMGDSLDSHGMIAESKRAKKRLYVLV